MRTGRRDWLWAIPVIILIGGGVAVMIMALTASSEPKADEPSIAGIECDRGEHGDYHVHAQLVIYIEGENVPIENNVGLIPTEDGSQVECLYWLHTHDASTGTIHVEAPREDDYTLGQFFAIWGQPLSETELLDQTANAEQSIRVTLNGDPFEGNPADIPLEDGNVIILEFGPPFRDA